jgi:cyclic pyranopterin phosphate synthase
MNRANVTSLSVPCCPRLALRLSITDRCQLRCAYCLPPQGAPLLPPGCILSFEEIVRFVRSLQGGFDLQQVRLTGGEPLVRRGVVNLVRMLAELRVPELALTTNGQRLAEMAGDLQHAGLDRVNVSLDSLDAAAYQHLTRGGELSLTVTGIEEARRVGLDPVKINTVVLRGRNDHEVADIARFGLDRGCVVRFLELMPIGCARALFDRHFVSSAETRARLATDFELAPLDDEGQHPSRDFLARDATGRHGTIGFVSPVSEPFCDGCRRVRLTSRGELIPCVASDRALSVAHLLDTDSPAAAQTLRAVLARELCAKVSRTAFAATRPMVAVGG